MSNHTLGPWTAPSAGIYAQDGTFVATVGTREIVSSLRQHGHDPSVDCFLNAQLIARAPSMVKCLQDLVEWAELMGGWESPAWDRALDLLNELGAD